MSWILAQTKTNAAKIARRNLERQGFEIFLPLEKVTQNRQGKLVSILKPYFGNYIFIRSNSNSAPVSAIHSTLAVQKLVKFGEKIAEVPLALVEDLRKACNEEGCLHLATDLSEGDKVRVATGPFKDQLGAVGALSTGDRIWAVLNIIGNETNTLMSSRDLLQVR